MKNLIRISGITIALTTVVAVIRAISKYIEIEIEFID